MNIDDIIENAQLKGRVIGLEATVETLTGEVKCLVAIVRAHERVDCLTVTSLKKQLVEVDAEVARLNSLIANSEHENARKIHGLQQDNEALQNRVDSLEG